MWRPQAPKLTSAQQLVLSKYWGDSCRMGWVEWVGWDEIRLDGREGKGRRKGAAQPRPFASITHGKSAPAGTQVPGGLLQLTASNHLNAPTSGPAAETVGTPAARPGSRS